MVYDLAEVSISETIGLDKAYSSLGWGEISWSIVGLLAISLIIFFSGDDEKK